MADTRKIQQAAERLRRSRYTVAFTGAGISVESGIPPFRGADGIWQKYNPALLEINHFRNHPLQSWKVIKALFYDHLINAQPNRAHRALSEMEQNGRLQAVITQNIDYLHQAAGSRSVIEYHGTYRFLICLECGRRYEVDEIDLEFLPPFCPQCREVLKPDFVFFGEPIPEAASQAAEEAARLADVLLVIGSTGEVVPAALIPPLAKQSGAYIIEINTSRSQFTATVTDLFLPGPATGVMDSLLLAGLPAQSPSNGGEP